MLKQFSHVEDYLEIINGDRDPATGKIYPMFDGTSPIISLARYDVSIMSSMSAAAGSGYSLTDKQGELAVKLVLKYKRQLAAVGIDVSPMENPKYRLPLRIVDRKKQLSIEGDKIILKFPYDTKSIDGIRELSKISHGSWVFDRDQKVWKLAITEANVIAAGGFARNNEFEISPEFLELERLVVDCESTPYAITLVVKDNSLVIENAANTLIEYIENKIGGFDATNIVKLMDYSGSLGYSVSPDITESMTFEFSPVIQQILLNQYSKFSPPPTQDVLEDIVEYASMTNRWPIYVYEPDMSDKLLHEFATKYFNEDEILSLKATKVFPSNIEGKKVIHFNKYNSRWNLDIPLLISSAGMMHGGEKTMMLQSAEKVIFFAAEIYNKNLSKT